MGNEVTMGEALVVTVVSMGVVFIVLILISLTIGFLKSMEVGKKETKKVAPVKQEKPVKNETTAAAQTSEEDEEELIAVITAAVANSLGVDIPEIYISSIRRTPQATTVWREIGKQEQIMGRM
ncbi:OadG family protein [Gudongella sp. DL1XJH-153]|uniref:OadG family protein n=1 Tax=Gudongella sp. DL1XJH-153 TaxID=3409804 RepID=UPI003BB7DCB9